jgi:phosphatidate cytidylyltransferase
LVASITVAQAAGAEAVLLVGWATIPLVFGLIVARPNMGESGDSVFVTVFGVWWIALALAQAVLLRGLDHGAGVLLIALICTFASDIGAYFGGRSFGERPLAPRLSPRKTVEGLLVGIVCSLAVAVASTLYADWLGFASALAIGATVAVLAPAGDLFESMLKRDAGAKDTAKILGPHGGLLDRLDGVIFAVVGAYWVWLAIV